MSAESNYRYERKFSLPGTSLPEAEAAVKLLPGMFSEIYCPRFVNNLYLDSFRFSSFFDNVDGVRDRRKIRVRWYGDFFTFIAKPVLEIKLKKGLLGKKESYALKPFLFDGAFHREILMVVLQSSEIPALLKMELNELEPSLANRYQRKYFQSADRKFRITIDSDMAYYHVNMLYNSFLNSSVDDAGIIIEIKYNAGDDTYIKSLLTHFPFRLTKSSKYVIGKDRVSLA